MRKTGSFANHRGAVYAVRYVCFRFAIPLLGLTMRAVPAAKATGAPTRERAREEHAYALRIQAALWGYPLVEYLNTNYAAMKSGASYLNYLRRFDSPKTAADRYVVTPNNMSIDGYGAADLRKEPIVLSVPSLQTPRWYLVQVGDMFDELAYDVAGYKGPETGLFLVTGPDYAGPIPANMRQLKVRTQFAVVALRIFVQGDADLPAALEVQRGFHMLPLSVFQASGLKYIVPKTDPSPLLSPLLFVPSAPEPIHRFEQIGAGMKVFLSNNDDYANPLVMSFRPIGLSVANGFDWKALDEATNRGLARAATAADQIIEDAYLSSAEVVNGWRYTMSAGCAGNDFPLRATLAKYVLGANIAEQSLYPNTRVDDAGQPLSGGYRCTSTRQRFRPSRCSGTSRCTMKRRSSSKIPRSDTASAARPMVSRRAPMAPSTSSSSTTTQAATSSPTGCLRPRAILI